MNLFLKHEVRYMFRRGDQVRLDFHVQTRRASEVPLTFSFSKVRSKNALVKPDEGLDKWHFDYR